MRLFFAIKVPKSEAVDELLSELGTLGGGLKPIRFGNQHITLKFIGDPGVNLDDVINSVRSQDLEIGPFRSRISDFGVFPNWDRPAVLWIGFSEEGTMRRLAEGLDRQLHERIGSPLEKRGFRSHLTVARCKGRPDENTIRKTLKKCVQRMEEEDYVLEVDSFDLVSSILTPKGPIYESVKSFHLEG